MMLSYVARDVGGEGWGKPSYLILLVKPQRVPLAKLVDLDGDILLYLAALMVATLA